MALAYDFNINDIISASCDLAEGKHVNVDSLIFEESITVSDFASNHYIQTGIEHNTPILAWEQPKNWDFLKRSSDAGCSWNSCSLATAPTRKDWSPVNYDCSLDFCWDSPEWTKNLRTFWNLACQSDPEAEFNNVFYSFVIEQMMKAYNDSLWRIAYFDYKDNTNPDYAGIDNFFIKMLGVVNDPLLAQAQYVKITENDGVDIENQMTLASDTGYNTFKAMYEKMLKLRPYMMTKSGLKYRVTEELAFNYLMYLQENREVNCCYSATDGITGSKYSIDNLNYMGIPIEIVPEWTMLIKHIAGESATVYDKPHRAVLTYDTEFAVGTCDMASFKKVKKFFDVKDEKLFIGIKTNIDVNLTFDKHFILAI